MPLSAHAALREAKINIEAARKARGSRPTIIKHYQTAKLALDKVEVKTTGDTALGKMVVAFEDLAEVLDHSREQLQERAAKCRQRAETLRRILDERMRDDEDVMPSSLAGPGPSQGTAQAGVVHVNSSAGVSSSSISASSTETVINTSATTAGNGTSTLRQLPIPFHQGTISLSAVIGIQASLQFFNKDVTPISFICLLPDPGEPLQTTRQLAYCLALLQPSVQEGGLSSDTLKWRHSILNNTEEKDRLETLSAQIIQTFAEDPLKGAAAVMEVTQLAPVLNGDHSRFLLKTFIDTVNQSEILHLHSLEGLANVIRGVAPGAIDSSDLVGILRSIFKKLNSTHAASHHNHHLLATVSRVLDAMVDASIEDVDRVKLYEPLSDLLRESEASKNPYLAFQAAYATQALLNVPDDESIWHAGFRRVCLVVKGGAGFAKMADPTEIKDALEGLEKLYESGKGGVRLFKDIKEAIKYDERPTFTKEEGLKFKRAWYHALRAAETYIQAGSLVQFKDLVTTTPCRHQLMFQWGICLLLGRLVTDTSQWDLEVRQDAVLFLGALYRDTGIWNQQREVDQVIFDILTNVSSNNDKHFEAAKPMLEEIKKTNTALKPVANLQSLVWNNFQSAGPAESTISNATLLEIVQDRNRLHAKLENLPDPTTQPSLDDINSALRTYHASDLVILRVSGDKLDLETCFINLEIVEASSNRVMERQDLQDKASVFHRFSSFERVKNANTQSFIPLEQLFNKLDGEERVQKRILVQGRAGIGKTTLCKKLVHAHQNGLWRDLFDAALWIPLRQLRRFKSNTLEDLFREKVFIAQNRIQHQVELAEGLVSCAEKGRVLFILDGLDEIATYTGSDESKTFRSFLKALLSQQYVVVTSRPSGVDSSLLPPIDLELETVGFSQQDVSNFVVKVLDPEAARIVNEFIQQTPLIQGLVNIPVQLDVICFSWSSLPRDGTAITMTALYQLMVRKLWCKDALRLNKTAGGRCLTDGQVSDFKPMKIDGLMATELQHLGYLAFKGMNNNHQIEFDKEALLCAFEDLEDEATGNERLSPSQLVDVMKETSFLHTTDASPDSKACESRQAWHFLHLTFQEYFAATWIVRHLQPNRRYSTAGMMTVEQLEQFVHLHKYNPQYEIVWSMVVGLLEGEPLKAFFGLFQEAPRDLIGGRHQRILASWLNGARDRVDLEFAADLDAELKTWLHFEMKLGKHDSDSKSMLGSQNSFPEASLIETVGSVQSWKTTLFNTLAIRSVLSVSAIKLLITTLMDENAGAAVRCSATSALSNQSTLPECAILSLIVALNCNDYVRNAVNSILIEHSTMPESAIQSLVVALGDENKHVSYSAARALGNQNKLPESVIRFLIASFKDDDEDVRFTAASVFGSQSVLTESAVQPLIEALKDEDKHVQSAAASAFGNQSTWTGSTIQSRIASLYDEDEGVEFSEDAALFDPPSLLESVIQGLCAVFDEEDTTRRLALKSVQEKMHSLCISLPQQTEDAIACIYERYLFIYSCSHILSLQVQNGRMWLYTEQGAIQVQLTDGDEAETILSAFRGVQHKHRAGLES